MKVRMQTQTLGHHIHYNGMFQCLRHMMRTEGVSVFYRGILPPLMSVAGVNSILFGTYGTFRRLLQDSAEPLTLPQIAICGV